MAAYDAFTRKAAQYRERFNVDPSRNPVPKSVVREYTIPEKNFLEVLPGDSKENRLVQILGRIQIDKCRYLQAMSAHPEMTEHFERLIDASKPAESGWVKHYEAEHQVDLEPGAVEKGMHLYGILTPVDRGDVCNV